MKIPIFRPKLPTYEKLEPYLRQIDSNRQYSNFGPLTKLLESRFAEHVGASTENVITCTNATMALQGAAQILKRSNKPWKLPVYTFVATAHALRNTGQNFSLVDIAPDLHIESTRVDSDDDVVHVLPFGDSFPVNSYNNFLGDLIIDAAASYDAVERFARNRFRGRVVLVVSLHPTKYPGGGEGALIYSNDTHFIEKFHNWTVFGFDHSRSSLMPGTNAKMSEYAAAVALASLDSWADRRVLISRQIARAVQISNESELQVHPAMRKGLPNPYWIVFCEEESRLHQIKEKLVARKVEFRSWWSEGIHKHPYFAKDITKIDFPICDNVVSCSIALPFYEDLHEEQFEYIRESLA